MSSKKDMTIDQAKKVLKSKQNLAKKENAIGTIISKETPEISARTTLKFIDSLGETEKKDIKKVKDIIPTIRSLTRELRIKMEILGEEAIDAIPVFTAALEKGNSNTKRIAAHILGYIGKYSPQETVPALIHTLEDKKFPAKETSAWALGEIGEDATAAIPILKEHLHDSKPPVRESAAYALGYICKGKDFIDIIPKLIDVNQTKDQHPNVKNAALKVLENNKFILLGLLSKDNITLHTRQSLETTLVDIEKYHPNTVLPFAKSIQNDKKTSLQQSAKNIVKALKESAIRDLKDDYWSTRSKAAILLKNIKDNSKEVIDALTTALGKELSLKEEQRENRSINVMTINACLASLTQGSQITEGPDNSRGR